MQVNFATLYLGALPDASAQLAAILDPAACCCDQDSLALFSDGLELLVQVIFVEV